MIYGISKLPGLHPSLWGAVAYLGTKSEYDWKIVSGTRDSSEQAANYAIGRTVQLDSPTVTDAPPGSSPHEFGLAVDVHPTLDKGASIVLDSQHPAWDEKTRIISECPFGVREISISSGQDRPHIEVKDWAHLKNWKSDYLSSAMVIGAVAVSLLVLR